MRIAVAGAHGTGKSTLIAAFLARRPDYGHEPEAFETLGDDVDVSGDEGPTPEGLHALLEHTVRTVAAHAPGARVVHERSPADYVAYAAASRAWAREDRRTFVEEHRAMVRSGLAHLDLVLLLPLSPEVPARPGEDPRFRRRVDEQLRRALLDDDHGLLAAATRVVALPSTPARWLEEMLRTVA